MEKIKAKPMQISKFLLAWMLSVYLLWPLLIIPTTIVLYLLSPNAYFSLEYIYWVGPNNKAFFVATFTIAMGLVQAWMFRRLLYVQIRHWAWATIIGGLIGTLIMWWAQWYPPFEMLPWFVGVSLAQWWLLHTRAKNAWLWVLAHVSLSLFFPIYAETWLLVVAKWLIATSVYGMASLLVLRQLGRETLVEAA
jgi:hypothetical protein